MPTLSEAKAASLAKKLRAYDEKEKNPLTKLADSLYLKDKSSYGPVKAIYGNYINPEVEDYAQTLKDYENLALDTESPIYGGSSEYANVKRRERDQSALRSAMKQKYGY